MAGYDRRGIGVRIDTPKARASVEGVRKVALYLTSVFVHDMPSGNPDVTDRSSRGLQRPWDSAGRHVYILNKPEQLRGPLSPHRKAGPQNREAGISCPSVVACVPLSTQRRLCVLDIQDSCCPLFFSTIGGRIGEDDATVLCKSTRGRPIASEDNF